MILKSVQPTRTVTQDEITDAVQKELRRLGNRGGVLCAEGALLFGEEFDRGTTLILAPEDDLPIHSEMEWEDFPPEPYKLVHHAILVMAERENENIKELKIELANRVLWVYEGRNIVVSVMTEAGSGIRKGMWRLLRNFDKHSDAIQRLGTEDALIQNVKDGHVICSRGPDGEDRFHLSPKGIKHVEKNLL